MRTRVFDAFGALAYLRSRADIDGARIGVIGWSQGAGTAYLSDFATIVSTTAPGGNGFAAAIALYPPCRTAPKAIRAPLLFLLGQDDDWTPAADCQADADLLKDGTVPVVVHVYPGATHSFDNPGDRGVVHVGQHTYTLNYDAGAAKDARDQVAAFLAAQMKK